MAQKLSLALILSTCILSMGFSQNLVVSSNPDHIINKVQNHVDASSTQKIFLHLDKSNYKAGETIWFKGYLVDGVTHLPDTSAANVYVELWDTQGEAAARLVIAPRAGSFQGDIRLGRDIADGNYMLRAYTDWMLNQGDAFMFTRPLYLSNPEFANVIDNNTRRFNRNFNQQLESMRDEITVSFFPEGGQLVAGLESRVAVKVADATGRGLQTSGEIKNHSGQAVASFVSNEAGYALFTFTPTSAGTYRADVSIDGRRGLSVDLPRAGDDGFVMQADIVDEEWLDIRIARAGTVNDHVVLLAHTRGKVMAYRPDLEIRGSETIRLSRSDFPTGIAHITLFAPDATPLAERLVFVNHHDQAYFDMEARALRAGEMTALQIDILSSDRLGNPIKGDFSVSVQYSPEHQRSYRDNIFSYLLLSGDLQGVIADPGFYFDFQQDDVEHALDMLMLTHDWRRFDWGQVIAAPTSVPTYMSRHGIIVGGTAIDPDSKFGLREVNLTLRTVEDRAVTFSATTDAHGAFVFKDVNLTDSVLVEVIAQQEAALMTPHVELLGSPAAGRAEAMGVLEPNYLTRPQQVTDRGRNWRRVRPERQARERSGQPSMYGQADQVIHPDPDIYYPSMIDLLRDKSVGLSITPAGNITVRGPSSINFQAPPIFIVDGVESQGGFLGLDVREVDRVEIFRGGSSAVFGARGVNGALVAYTRKRDFVEAPTAGNMFLISGLHAPGHFLTDAAPPAIPASDNDIVTVHWEPNLQTGENGLASFQFLPLPRPGQYRIVIQGVGIDGKIGYGEFVIGL